MTTIVRKPVTCDACGALVLFGKCSNLNCSTNQTGKSDEPKTDK